MPVNVPDDRLLLPVVYSRRTAAERLDWTGQWVCVGVAEQLRHPGAVLPAGLGEHPVHVRRNQAGELVAAFNARPFGGCVTVPGHCAGSQKIRCPHLACAFSADPDVLDDQTDPGGRSRLQFTGTSEKRTALLPLTRWGSLVFVNVTMQNPDPLFDQFPSQLLGELEPSLNGPFTDITSTDVKVDWQSAGAVFASVVAERIGGVFGDPNGTRAPAYGSPVIVRSRIIETEEDAILVRAWPSLTVLVAGEHTAVCVVRPTSRSSCRLTVAIATSHDRTPARLMSQDVMAALNTAARERTP